MTNKGGKIGSEAETAVVKVFKDRGIKDADRIRLGGAGFGEDRGDIKVPGYNMTVQVKGGHMAEGASDNQVDLWLDELEKQCVVNGHELGILVMKRYAVGAANAHRWWCAVRARRLIHYLSSSEYVDDDMNQAVRMPLGDMLDLLGVGGAPA